MKKIVHKTLACMAILFVSLAPFLADAQVLSLDPASTGTWNSDFTFLCSGTSTGDLTFTDSYGHSKYIDIYSGVPGASTLANGHFVGGSAGNTFTGDCTTAGAPLFAVAEDSGSVSAFRTYFQTGGSPPSTNYSGAWLSTAPPPPDTTTHIISFTPGTPLDSDAQLIATSSAVTFSVHDYINSADLGSYYGVSIFLQNVDENSIFPTANDLVLLNDVEATSSGDFYYSTTTPAGFLSAGNYRVVHSISRTYLGIFKNPFSAISASETQHFIYGQGTLFGGINDAFHVTTSALSASTTLATSTEALASGCSPFSGQFNVQNCMLYLFVPGAPDVATLWSSLYGSVLNSFPLGYVTRFVSLALLTDATEPPAISYSFGSSSPAVLQADTATDPITFQIFSNSVMGTTSPLWTTKSDQPSSKNIWDIVDPYFTDVVGMAILFVILEDILGLSFSESAFQNEGLTRAEEMKVSNPTRTQNIKALDRYTANNAEFRKNYERDYTKKKML